MGYVARQMLYGLADRGGYANKVLRTNPIAYWPLWEASGTVAECLVNRAQDGTYSSDVSSWPPGVGIGDGNTAPFFDGTNDEIDILTASLQGAFDGDAGTICAWVRVLNAAMWPDANQYLIIGLKAPGDNWVYFQKDDAPLPNELFVQRGATAIVGNPYTTTITDWFHAAATWDEVANELNIFVNGDQNTGAAALAAWVGVLSDAFIGARDGGVRWNGWLANVALWSRVLPLATIVSLATL